MRHLVTPVLGTPIIDAVHNGPASCSTQTCSDLRGVVARHIAKRLRQSDDLTGASFRAEAVMAAPDVEMLAWLVSRFVRRAPLTHDERREVLHVARGLAAPDSAQIERVPVEVIRARRKAIYRKLRLAGSNQLVSGLLALALARLAKGNGNSARGRRGPRRTSRRMLR